MYLALTELCSRNQDHMVLSLGSHLVLSRDSLRLMWGKWGGKAFVLMVLDLSNQAGRFLHLCSVDSSCLPCLCEREGSESLGTSRFAGAKEKYRQSSSGGKRQSSSKHTIT